LAIDRSPRADAGVTKGQLEAIEEAMRILIEEDRERGVDPSATFACSKCRRPQPSVGSVDYQGIRLCNQCATRFEVARINGRTRTSAEYVGRAPRAT